ncbi:MAG: transporter dctQ related transrane protein [candidate division NC10 bacterium]|jgi:TRAP-type mannitol/chloroaromatic compound transport system permease small subunit|nr:transporter dctQ related transrane protein [candidate division NC10 bacterium]
MQAIKWIDTLSLWSGTLIAWLAIPLTGIVTYEVFMRYVMNMPTQWVYDASWMLHSTAFLIAGAYTLSVKRHVRIDMLYNILSKRGKAIFDLLIFGVVVLPVMGVLTWEGVAYAAEAWSTGEKLSTSLWEFPSAPIRTMIPVGFFLVLLQTVAEILRCLQVIRTESHP